MFSGLNRTNLFDERSVIRLFLIDRYSIESVFRHIFISSEAMNGSMPLVKVGLQISDPLYSVLDISKSNIKDVSRVTGTLG